jgi:hypothetical protein
VAPTGKPGSVLMFHGNLVHASPPNITPYPRKIVYLTLCAVSNHITKFTRARMDRSPRFHTDRAGGGRRLRHTCARASRRGGMTAKMIFCRDRRGSRCGLPFALSVVASTPRPAVRHDMPC